MEKKCEQCDYLAKGKTEGILKNTLRMHGKAHNGAELAKGPTTVYEAEQFMQFFVNMVERHPERSIDELMNRIKMPKGTLNVQYLERARDVAEE